MTKKSVAGPGEGIEAPEDITAVDVHTNEVSHGSPKGESGLVVLWDGNEHDFKSSWIMCEHDAVFDLSLWK